jgi:hypothetical protein
LDIVAEIHEGAKNTTKRLSKAGAYTMWGEGSGLRPVRIGVQSKAIRRASEAKYMGIHRYVAARPLEVSSLVEFFGKLCNRLQSDQQLLGGLKTGEKGIFVLDLRHSRRPDDPISRAKEEIRAVLRAGEADGVWRVQTPEYLGQRAHEHAVGGRFLLQLHRRFSAYFGYSYRGPYQAIEIPVGALISVMGRSTRKSELSTLVERTFKMMVRSQRERTSQKELNF